MLANLLIKYHSPSCVASFYESNCVLCETACAAVLAGTAERRDLVSTVYSTFQDK